MGRGLAELLSSWSVRHPRWTIGIWSLAVLLSLLAWRGADGALTTGASILTGADSRLGSELIDQRFGDADTASTRVVCAVEGLANRSVEPVAPGEPTGESQHPPDPGATLDVAQCYEAKWAMAAGQAPSSVDTLGNEEPGDVRRMAPGSQEDVQQAYQDGLTLLFPPAVGDVATAQQQEAAGDTDFRDLVRDDLIRSERIAVPLAFVILVLVIRAWFSPLIPILIGGIAVTVAVGVTVLVARMSSISVYAINMIVMVGLAVGIDYTLLVLERYREERRAGTQVTRAISGSSASAGHAVLASGTTVIISLAGMLLVPISVVRDIALGAILVVVLGVAAALTVLPAMLWVLGERIDPRRQGFVAFRARRERGPGFWRRWAAVVTRYPLLAASFVLVALGALSIQMVNLERGLSPLYAVSEPEGGPPPAGVYWEQEVATTLMSVAEVVVDGARSDETDAGIERLIAGIGRDNDFTPILTRQTNDAGDLTVIRALAVWPASSSEAGAAIERLRHEIAPTAFGRLPANVFVTGPLTVQWDVIQIIETWQPRIIGFVLGMSFIVLLVVFRSIVVPLVATLTTLLSVSAATGVVVLVIQEGYGASLLGIQETSMIEVWVPIVLFSILFGMSMDYHVFLLSRIQERIGPAGDTTAAIAFGVRSTGGIICGAALIMVIVFGSFASGQLVLLQQIGFGLAVAILIDAFLVRLILVPATMTILGIRNWYLPGWLEQGRLVHSQGCRSR